MKESPVGTGLASKVHFVRAGIRVRPLEFDLASRRGVRAVLAWRGFPGVLQATLLATFIVLAVLAWGVFTPDGVNPKLFAKSNLVTLVIWGLWWPAMVWGAVFLGRAWCLACPLEFLSDIGERLGRRLGLRSRPLPRWIATGGIIVVLYILLQVLVAGVQLHRTPGYTSLFLLSLLALALTTALVFRHRAFCRGFCPVGLLLGTYGRGGILAMRPGPADTSGGPDARVCPTLLNPSRLDSSRDCLVCCRCIKASAPGAMRLVVRPLFCAVDSRLALASWPVTVFVMVASGFVTAELCTEWPAVQAMFLSAPKAAATALHAPQALRWLEAAWTLGVIPLGLWLLLAGSLRAAGGSGKVGELWRGIALPMAIIVAAGHMAKGLAKFVSWFPFLPHALREPDGTATAIAITRRLLVAPKSPVALSTVGIVGLVLIVAALFFAIREHRLSRPGVRGGAVAIVPYGIMAALFGAIVTGWVIQ